MRSTWARLIHKVYEVDPLECPRCKGPMRVIALIDDAAAAWASGRRNRHGEGNRGSPLMIHPCPPRPS